MRVSASTVICEFLNLRGGEFHEINSPHSLMGDDIEFDYQPNPVFEDSRDEPQSERLKFDPQIAHFPQALDDIKIQINNHMDQHFPRYLENALKELILRKPLNKKDAGFIQDICISPESVSLLEKYGRWLSEVMHEPNRAEQVYRYALLIHPSSSKLFFLKAEALENVPGKLYDAEIAYRHALLHDPQNVAALTAYGRLLLDEFEDVQGAGDKLEQAVAIDPVHADALCQRARVHEMRGDMAAAERMYRRALRSEPGSAAGLNNYATLLMETSRPAEALEVMVRGLRCSDRAGPVLYNYGLLLEQLGEAERAESVFKEAAEKCEIMAAECAGPAA